MENVINKIGNRLALLTVFGLPIVACILFLNSSGWKYLLFIGAVIYCIALVLAFVHAQQHTEIGDSFATIVIGFLGLAGHILMLVWLCSEINHISHEMHWLHDAKFEEESWGYKNLIESDNTFLAIPLNLAIIGSYVWIIISRLTLILRAYAPKELDDHNNDSETPSPALGEDISSEAFARTLLWFNDATPVYVDTSWLEQKYAAYGDPFDLSKITPSASVKAAPFGVGVAGSTSAEWTKNKDKGRAVVIIAIRVLTRLQAIGKLHIHIGILAADKIDSFEKRKILTSLFSQTFQNDPDDQWTDEWLERNVAHQKLATNSVGDSMLISEDFVLNEDKKNKEYILSYTIPKVDGVKGDGLIIAGRLPMQKVSESQRHIFKTGNRKLTVLGEVSDIKYKKKSAGGASEVTLHVEVVLLGLIDSAYTKVPLPEPS